MIPIFFNMYPSTSAFCFGTRPLKVTRPNTRRSFHRRVRLTRTHTFIICAKVGQLLYRSGKKRSRYTKYLCRKTVANDADLGENSYFKHRDQPSITNIYERSIESPNSPKTMRKNNIFGFYDFQNGRSIVWESESNPFTISSKNSR